MGTCSSKPQFNTKVIIPRNNKRAGNTKSRGKVVVVAILENEKSFSEKLGDLTCGPSTIPTAMAEKLIADAKVNPVEYTEGLLGTPFGMRWWRSGELQHPMDYTKGLLGTPFGSTMDEVVAQWGIPCGITMMLLDQIDLEIYRCRFRFHRNRLTSITVHEMDSFDVEPLPGLKLGAPVPSLTELFPEGVLKPPRVSKYSHVDTIQVGNISISTHCLMDGESKGKLMHLTVSRDIFQITY